MSASTYIIRFNPVFIVNPVMAIPTQCRITIHIIFPRLYKFSVGVFKIILVMCIRIITVPAIHTSTPPAINTPSRRRFHSVVFNNPLYLEFLLKSLLIRLYPEMPAFFRSVRRRNNVSNVSSLLCKNL